MARPATKQKPTKSLEQTLWKAADKLRGNLEPSKYKHVVLGLVFLKYISDRFEERRQAPEVELSANGIKPERLASFLEDRDEYTSHNVLWVPELARWHAEFLAAQQAAYTAHCTKANTSRFRKRSATRAAKDVDTRREAAEHSAQREWPPRVGRSSRTASSRPRARDHRSTRGSCACPSDRQGDRGIRENTQRCMSGYLETAVRMRSPRGSRTCTSRRNGIAVTSPNSMRFRQMKQCSSSASMPPRTRLSASPPREHAKLLALVTRPTNETSEGR